MKSDIVLIILFFGCFSYIKRRKKFIIISHRDKYEKFSFLSEKRFSGITSFYYVLRNMNNHKDRARPFASGSSVACQRLGSHDREKCLLICEKIAREKARNIKKCKFYVNVMTNFVYFY